MILTQRKLKKNSWNVNYSESVIFFPFSIFTSTLCASLKCKKSFGSFCGLIIRCVTASKESVIWKFYAFLNANIACGFQNE